jgi:enoyl-CoA hydratase
MGTEYEHILCDIERHTQGSIYRLTVSRPERLNILDSAMLRALTTALAEIAHDENARLVILAAADGKAWIAGADIREMRHLDKQGAAEFIRRLHAVCHAVRALPVPVLARISGYCLGAGLELAASCDLRVASDDSRFGMPEVRVGIPSVIEAALLPRLIGIGRARDLVLTGRVVGAEEAYAWGLIEAPAPRAALDALVQDRARQILAAGPRAVRLQKELCNRWEELSLSAAIDAGIDTFSRAFEGDEPSIYMERFLRAREQDTSAD